jgi:hypothetical protein
MIAHRLSKNALWWGERAKPNIEFFNSSREKQDSHGSPAQLLIIGKMGQKMSTYYPL